MEELRFDAKGGREAKEELTMGRRIDEIIVKLPKERRKRVTKRANEMAKVMIAHADSLRVVRKALSKS